MMNNEMDNQTNDIWVGQGLMAQTEGEKLGKIMTDEEVYNYAEGMIANGRIYEYRRYYGKYIWYLLNTCYTAYVMGSTDYASIREFLDAGNKTRLDKIIESEDKEIHKVQYLAEEKKRVEGMSNKQAYAEGKKMVEEIRTGCYRRYYGEDIWKMLSDKYMAGKNEQI